MIRRRSPRYYNGEFFDVVKAFMPNKHDKGHYVGAFEDDFRKYVGVGYAIATCSGRNALACILDELGLKAGDEVIIPAYTLKDLVQLVLDKGLIPRLVDVEKGSFNIDPSLLQDMITGRTKVIVATHMFGLPCDIEKIVAIAKPRGIYVVEDCAHALGATVGGRRVGSLADAAFFSFETIKSINTFGGGMITTNDRSLADKIKSDIGVYANSGKGLMGKMIFSCVEDMIIRSPAYNLLIRALADDRTTRFVNRIYLSAHNKTRVGGGKYTDLQACLGLKQLPLLDDLNRRRSRIAAILESRLDGRAALQSGVTATSGRIFYFFVVKMPIEVGSVGKVRQALVRRGIDVGIRSEITDNCAAYIGQEASYPVAREVYDSVIQLPMHDNLSDRDVSKIAAEVNRIINERYLW